MNASTPGPQDDDALPPCDRGGAVWVFGYGSLIWKVDFPVRERAVARLHGWARRFWQGSHDHRGTPAAPGRVLTLVPAPGAVCTGMAYRVLPEVFVHLDRREKNGYHRVIATLHLADGRTPRGVAYVAGPGNPAWLGDAPMPAIAGHIERAAGPSGGNVEYLLRLAAALRALGEDDPHVTELDRLLRARATPSADTSGRVR